MGLSSLTNICAVVCVTAILSQTSAWHLVMKLPQGREITEARRIVDLWNSTLIVDHPHREYPVDNMVYTQLSKPYKAAFDNWNERKVQQVRISLYQQGSEEAFIVFNASRASRTSWFSCDRIIDSSFSDLLGSNTAICDITGTTNETKGRSFMVYRTRPNTHCENSEAWTMLLDLDNQGVCHWEYVGMFPQFLFTNNSRDMTLSSTKADMFGIFVDDCAGIPCKNGGTCTNTGSDHVCDCGNDYYGADCEVACPCKNSGNCIRLTQSQMTSQSFVINFTNYYSHTVQVVPGSMAYCVCRAGYTGDQCENDIDDCEPNPCKNGGDCKDGVNKFTCMCQVGYTGDDCSVEDENYKEKSGTGASITAAIVVPIILIMVIAATIWCVYIYRNPEGYGRKQTFRTVALVRDTIRRSFRRLSGRGRHPKRQPEPSGFNDINGATSASKEKGLHRLKESPKSYEQDVPDDDDDGGFSSRKQLFHEVSLDTGFEIPADEPPYLPMDGNAPVPAPRRQMGRQQTRSNQNQSDEPPPYQDCQMNVYSNPIPSTTI